MEDQNGSDMSNPLFRARHVYTLSNNLLRPRIDVSCHLVTAVLTSLFFYPWSVALEMGDGSPHKPRLQHSRGRTVSPDPGWRNHRAHLPGTYHTCLDWYTSPVLQVSRQGPGGQTCSSGVIRGWARRPRVPGNGVDRFRQEEATMRREIRPGHPKSPPCV
jgi:hypothetical protein